MVLTKRRYTSEFKQGAIELTIKGSVAKKDHMRVEYLPWIVIGGSRDGFQVETYRANDYNNGSPLVSSLLIKL
jgi:hypothetical protein